MAFQSLGGDVVGKIPAHYIRNGVVDRRAMYSDLVENRTLREDETRQIEEALTRVARRDLQAVADLRAAGLNVPLRNIGVTSYEFDRVAPVGEAEQSMSILNLGERDLVTFARTAIPVPVTASQFRMDARHQAAGTSIGEPVSLTNVEEHTRAVAEKLEDTLVNGSDVVLGGNGLPGYTSFAARESLSFGSGPWDELTPANIQDAVRDVLNARTALRDNGFTGPYVVYVSSDFDGVLDDDYKAFSDRTLRERLLAIEGVNAVRVLASLPDQSVLMVQLTRSVVQMPVGQDITTVTWDRMGGLAMNWAILAVLSFALKEAFARPPLREGVLPPLTTAAGIAHIS
jgi:uncharacterized linocin/CFP29 family protein